MGMIGQIVSLLFGRGENVVRDTVEIFRENTEAGAARDSDIRQAALDAFRAEFLTVQGGGFNRFMDGVNRLPRPALALSTLALFAAAMISPDWFAQRMVGVSRVPEPLWWLMGVIVSFYFGARYQVKGQEFQRAIAATLMRDLSARSTPSVFRPMPSTPEHAAKSELDELRVDISENAALADWYESSRGK